MTFIENCPADTTETLPVDPLPCVEDSCSVRFGTIREGLGKLIAFLRIPGSPADITRDTTTTAGAVSGVLRNYRDTDGTCLGVDVALHNDPGPLTAPSCGVDSAGNSNYVNGLRRIAQGDGTHLLGTLPLPIQDRVCTEVAACTQVIAPDNAAGESFQGCNETDTVVIENTSCYPMIVVPSIDIESASIAAVGEVTYRVRPSENGSFTTSYEVFSSGTGNTTGNRSTYSGTVTLPSVEIAAGATYTLGILTDLTYDNDTNSTFEIDWGTRRLCLHGFSKVTPATIAALEA